MNSIAVNGTVTLDSLQTCERFSDWFIDQNKPPSLRMAKHCLFWNEVEKTKCVESNQY